MEYEHGRSFLREAGHLVDHRDYPRACIRALYMAEWECERTSRCHIAQAYEEPALSLLALFAKTKMRVYWPSLLSFVLTQALQSGPHTRCACMQMRRARQGRACPGARPRATSASVGDTPSKRSSLRHMKPGRVCVTPSGSFAANSLLPSLGALGHPA